MAMKHLGGQTCHIHTILVFLNGSSCYYGNDNMVLPMLHGENGCPIRVCVYSQQEFGFLMCSCFCSSSTSVLSRWQTTDGMAWEASTVTTQQLAKWNLSSADTLGQD